MWTPDPEHIVTAEMKAAEKLATTENSFRLAIQNLLDETAKERRYDSGNSLASYDTASQPNETWRQEASAFVIWRSAVWDYAYAELDKVLNGIREVPTIEAFLQELPVMEWPE